MIAIGSLFAVDVQLIRPSRDRHRAHPADRRGEILAYFREVLLGIGDLQLGPDREVIVDLRHHLDT